MILVLFSICLFNFKGVFCDVSTAEDGKSGTISFTPPTLNDEEAHAIHIPRHLKCDACVIIAYKVRGPYCGSLCMCTTGGGGVLAGQLCTDA